MRIFVTINIIAITSLFNMIKIYYEFGLKYEFRRMTTISLILIIFGRFTLQCWNVSKRCTITCIAMYTIRIISTFLSFSCAEGSSMAKNIVQTPRRYAELPTSQCNQSKIQRFDVSGCGLKYAITGWRQAHNNVAIPMRYMFKYQEPELY